MKRLLIVFLLIMMLLPSFPQESKDIYMRKAALFKIFCQYVDWPGDTTVNDPSLPFIIGVIGENPFGTILEKAYSHGAYKIKGKEVQIRYVSRPEQIEFCHLLFICKSMENELERILAVTQDKPILTIGDTKGFAERGILFNLYQSVEEIRLEINAISVRRSGLTVYTQLLSVARIVGPLEAPK